eukprot:TRINITY_DN1875_c1_g1_i1.p1 TRINITY_DN1875_c1_g1~~TRINITY_DN1875_c1_g1_i1.p1  ORF type:complete len:417 (+),score=58.96 TRINITY_DN1875_c1_g1_i1:207-1457(+)
MDEIEEAWARREAARRRQIMIGKSRPEYLRYIAEVPVNQRGPERPTTPDPGDRTTSKRHFDRALGEWRRKLHEYDVATGEAPAIAGAAVAAVSLQVQQKTPQATSTSRKLLRGSERKGNSAPDPAVSGKLSSRPPTPLQSPEEEPQALQEAWPQDLSQQVPEPQQPRPPVGAHGIVQLRLADRLPGPPAMTTTAVSNGDFLTNNALTLPEPPLLALLGGQLPWPSFPMGPDMAATAATLLLRAGCAPGWPPLPPTPASMAQTHLASNPVTPCRPANSTDFNDDDETPPPIDMCLAAQHAQTIMKPMKVEVGEKPGEDLGKVALDDCVLIGQTKDKAASFRCASPPPNKGAFQERWCDIGSPMTPRPQRTRISFSPPSSVVKTPALLVPETPSPERLYHHHDGMFLPLPDILNWMGI